MCFLSIKVCKSILNIIIYEHRVRPVKGECLRKTSDLTIWVKMMFKTMCETFSHLQNEAEKLKKKKSLVTPSPPRLPFDH